MNKKIVIILAIIVIMILLVALFFLLNTCDYNNPNKNYSGKSVQECATIKFMCEPGTTGFQDKCGCGCIKINN